MNEPVVLEANLTGALAQLADVAGMAGSATFADDLDQVFLSLASPGTGAAWPGNVKKLKLLRPSHPGQATQADERGAIGQLVDVNGNAAVELAGNDKGTLRSDALTFWTDVSTLPPGDGQVIPVNADGRVVARGGAGQKVDGFVAYRVGQDGVAKYVVGDTNTDTPIDGFSPRQVFYESTESGEFEAFDASDVALEALRPLLDPGGELTDEALLDLVRWGRGQDTDNGTAAARGWLLGDILHSRPLVINYGATPGYSRENPNTRILFGSGDGLFHILENTDRGGNESGREVFAFYPAELLANLRWWHEADGAGAPHRYGVDGAPVALLIDQDRDGTLDYAAGDKAYVYFGLRRGGSSYFALDVSNPDAAPRLLWKISSAAGAGFEELGLTFSTPVAGKVNFSGVPTDVLIFAGGYDGGWNAQNTARRGKDLGADDDTVGNAIYIVDAYTGELVWKAVRGVTGAGSNTHYAHAGLVDSIPSSIAALATPAGIIHRLYVGDSGGAVWRVDLPPAPDADEDYRRHHWFVTKLADLGYDAAEAGGAARDDRRFFHAPDIVQSYDASGDFDGVVIQSGNRADPNETVVENAIFFIKDREVTTGGDRVLAENAVRTPPGRIQFDDLPDQTACIDAEAAVSEDQDDVSCADRQLESGWKMRFPEPGEKGLASPLIDGGRVFATTFIPGEANACSVRQGRGGLYVLQMRNATAVANGLRYYDLGPDIPSAVQVAGGYLLLPGGGVDLYDLDGDGIRDAAKLLPSAAGKLYRMYWREPDVDPL
ncbi:MAG: PilC/PilY family type IV pilus protein [Halioglobus sp.]